MNEAEDHGTTLMEKSMGPEMDLVNRPNPWLPAYGFQIQSHNANFQPTHEDLRANETMLVQQVDFLETILEETSDDLQSDSDRSGTTYWLGSDSETESVIHIKAAQRTADERQDGSGSECNSVVPKKRRRRNGSDDLLLAGCGSPRSSRDSSASSRSSSLLQFESLERTCATLSASSCSYDSLEYGQQQQQQQRRRTARRRLNGSALAAGPEHEICASPDSLELDYGQVNGYGAAEPGEFGSYGRLRPYRSFESLDERDLMPREQRFGGLLSNGFASRAFGKNCDLSRVARRPRSRRRDSWHLNSDADVHSDYEDSAEEEPSCSSSDDEDYARPGRYAEADQLLVFGDPSSAYPHAASLDCRNSVDLRAFGLDDSDDERSRRRESTFLELKASAASPEPAERPAGRDEADPEAVDPGARPRRQNHHHHEHRRPRRASGSLRHLGGCGGGGGSGSSFNFSFSDEWRSAPSLTTPGAAARSSSGSPSRRLCASAPVGLELRGRAPSDEEPEPQDAMAEPGPEAAPSPPPLPPTSTVKTQDRLEANVLELALAMERNVDAAVDEAIRQLRREVEEAALAGPREPGPPGPERPRVRNNASYELAQQWTVDEESLARRRGPAPEEPAAPRPRRVLNSASYELAQRVDCLRHLPVRRMDACEELRESPAREAPDSPPLLARLEKNSDAPSGPAPEGGGGGGSSAGPGPAADGPAGDGGAPARRRGPPPAPASGDGALPSRGAPVSSPAAPAQLGESSREPPRREQREEQQQQQQRPRPASLAASVAATTAPEMSATAAKRLARSGEPGGPGGGSAASLPGAAGKEERKKGGLGGFLQRFSKLRFSGRSKVPRSEGQRKKSASNGQQQQQQQQRPAGRGAEPNYVIVPLHAPEDEVGRGPGEPGPAEGARTAAATTGAERSASTVSANGRPPACIGSRKPPLPPQSLRSSSGCGGGGGGGGVGGVGVPQAPSRRRAATDLGNPAAIEMAKARAAMLAASSGQEPQQQQQHRYHHHQKQQQQQQQHNNSQRPLGLLETDLDAPADPEEAAAAKKARSLLNLNHNGHPRRRGGGSGGGGGCAALSLSLNAADAERVHGYDDDEVDYDDDYDDDYGDEDLADGDVTAPGGACRRDVGQQQHRQRHQQHHQHHHHHHHHHHRSKGNGEAVAGHQRPHKSMEFLLDKENLHYVKVPENELQKVGERVPSEHELRVQRSLQRLNVPDWYKNSPAARDGGGFRIKRHSDASQLGGWRALGSKTTSLSSLSSSSNRQQNAGALLSPSPTPPVFSRWSTSLLNSAGSSPASSARSSFNHRQPYLGWRSQERLSNPHPRTPAERLAQGMLPKLQNASKQPQQLQSPQHHHQQQPKQPPGGPTTNQEVRNSIKEVTSAIVHYVQSGQEVGGGGGGGRLSPRPDDDLDARGGSRSTSPRGSSRTVWMESSFVGVRQVESPDGQPSVVSPTSAKQQQQPRRRRSNSGGSSHRQPSASPSRGPSHPGPTTVLGHRGAAACPDEGPTSPSGDSTTTTTTTAGGSPGNFQLEAGEPAQDRRGRQGRERSESPSSSPTAGRDHRWSRERRQPAAEPLEHRQQQQQQRGELLLA